jgi:S1-C subfamily serine protease
MTDLQTSVCPIRRPRRPATLLLTAACLAALARTVAAQADAGEKIYQRVLRSTVWVIAGTTTGTGSLVDGPRRLVVTNHHVVGDKQNVDVLFPAFRNGRVVAERDYYIKNTQRIRGRVVMRDGRRDLAVIQLDGLPADALPLPLAKDSAAPGQRVHSVGNPSVSGALWVYTAGNVRQVYQRSFKLKDGREINARVVETQSPINSGDSGGPVVNDSAELVAVVQSYEGNDARLVSTFIDVTEVRAMLAGDVKPPTVTGGNDVPAPAGAAAARIDAVRQEHNFERDGRKGVAIRVTLEVRNAKGVAGEVVAVFQDKDGRPLKARNRAYSNAAGEMCTFVRITPGYDATAYKDLILFMPYDEMPTAPGRNEFRFLINVWADRRWVAEKAASGGFAISSPG